MPEKTRTQWALTKKEMKNCVWVKAELVAEIEFTEWTPDGHLRHSKFVGLRGDKGTQDVLPARLKTRAKDRPCSRCSPAPSVPQDGRHPVRRRGPRSHAVLKAMGCSSPRCTDTTPARSGKHGKALREKVLLQF
jgi:hypothetical protein